MSDFYLIGPLLAFLLSPPGCSLRHKRRLVALVEEDHAVQFVALQNGPAPARAGVHLVHAFPGPLDGGLPAPLGDAVIDVAGRQAELEFAHPVGPELDERRAFFHVVHVPLVHRDNVLGEVRLQRPSEHRSRPTVSPWVGLGTVEQNQRASFPPSTAMDAPVMKDALSDATNRMV